MKLSWLTAALLLLIPHSVYGQSAAQPTNALLPLKASTLDDTVPERKIEQLAQIYRTHVYHAFRMDREQYNQRRDAWHQTLAAWIAAGKPAAQRDELNNWLREATNAVQSSPPAPIPARPAFGAEVVIKPVEQSPPPVKTTPSIQPPVQQPIIQKPTAEQKPVAQKPVAQKPVAQKPVAQKPIAQKPVEQKQVVQQQIVQKLIVQQLIVQQPIVQQHLAQQPVAQQPVAQQPVAQQPVAQQPVAQQPVAQQPVAQQPVAQQPVVQKPIAQQPVVQQPVAQQPVIQKPSVRKPTASAATPPAGTLPPSRPSLYAGKEQPRRQYRPTTPRPGPVGTQSPTGRRTSQAPTIPTAGNATPAPPMPSQARQPSRIAPRVTPPRRNATPRSSVPSSRQLATKPQYPSSPRSYTGRRSWQSSNPTAARRTTSPSTRSSRNKSPVAQSPVAQSPNLPVLPGLSSKDFASVKKDEVVAQKDEVAQKDPVVKKPAVKKTDLTPKANKFSLGAMDDFDAEGGDAEVNLIELAARIAGTNMGLRGIENQLKESHKWDVRQLAPMVTSIKQMCDRRNDLTLFRNLLDESDRDLVGELDSPQEAISQCSARIAEVRARLESRSSRSKQRNEDLEKLDSQSRELAKLVTGSSEAAEK